MVTLIPVVEFEPYLYHKTEREYPEGDIYSNPKPWGRKWKLSLADSGITELSPTREGGWWVPVDQIQKPTTIRTLIDKAAQWPPDPEDGVPLEQQIGGYVLTNGTDQMEPGCCSDFSTIESWELAADWHSAEWETIWIGHPWTYVSASGDHLDFLEPTEDKPSARPHIAVQLMRQELLEAIQIAKEQVEAFSARVAQTMLSD